MYTKRTCLKLKYKSLSSKKKKKTLKQSYVSKCFYYLELDTEDTRRSVRVVRWLDLELDQGEYRLEVPTPRDGFLFLSEQCHGSHNQIFLITKKIIRIFIFNF